MPSMEIVEIPIDEAVASDVDAPSQQESSVLTNAADTEKRKRVTPKTEPTTGKPTKKQKKQQLTMGHFFSVKKSTPKEKKKAVEPATNVLDTLDVTRPSPLVTATAKDIGVLATPSAENTNANATTLDSSVELEKMEATDSIQSTTMDTKETETPPTIGAVAETEPSPAEQTVGMPKRSQEVDLTQSPTPISDVKETSDDVKNKAYEPEPKVPKPSMGGLGPKTPPPDNPEEAHCDAVQNETTPPSETSIGADCEVLHNGTIISDKGPEKPEESNCEEIDLTSPQGSPASKKQKTNNSSSEPTIAPPKDKEQSRVSKLEALMQECRNGLEEEEWELPIPPVPTGTSNLDACMRTLATLVEGSSESLSVLAERASGHVGLEIFSVEDIKAKILEVARRNHCLPVEDGADVNNDIHPDAMWRWEVVTTTLLSSAGIVRKVRAIRKKMATVVEALRNQRTTDNRLNQLEIQLQASRVTARSAWAEVCAKAVEKGQRKKPKSKSATTEPKKLPPKVNDQSRVLKLEALMKECRTGLEEETWEYPIPAFPTGTSDLDACIHTLATLVEGSSEPLSVLADRVLGHLGREVFSVQAIQTKIVEIASRNHYLPVQDGTDTHNDSNPDAMWRWEVVTTSLLSSAGTVRKVRGIRKKLAAVVEALRDQGTTDNRLNQLETQLQSARVTTRSAWAVLCAKAAEKERNAAAKEQKKQDAAQAKLKKLEEASLKKKQAEEAKQKKKEEVERKKEEETRKKAAEAKAKENLLKKQQRLLSAFVGKKRAAPQSKGSHKSWDVTAFRKALADEKFCPDRRPFRNLSREAKESRRRKHRSIQVPVTVAVVQEDGQVENPFAAGEAYSEEQMLTIKNRYSFFKFSEDVRPPYYGTWSKRSKLITGRTPTEKDSSFLNYDIDSEAEWEEGDDEIGEELDDDAVNEEDDDEEEEPVMGEDDGWLDADDEDGDSDRQALQLCYVLAPLNSQEREAVGFTPCEARDMLEKLKVTVVSTDTVVMDAAPAVATEENDEPELSDENLKTFASFVHNCRLGSKDRVVEEMLKAHKSVVSTRAQAYRVLDTVAEKKKHPLLGVVWQVKADVLETVGLVKLEENNQGEEATIKRTMAEFVHNRQTSSKERLIDEFREKHPIHNRQTAQRLLDSIAVKKRHPNYGVYWQVKKEIQDELGIELPAFEPQNEPSAKTWHTEQPLKGKSSSPKTSAPTSSPKKGISASSKLMEAFVRPENS